MSSSQGLPSRKIRWYRSMVDAIDFRTRIVEKEKKKAEGGKKKVQKEFKPAGT